MALRVFTYAHPHPLVASGFVTPPGSSRTDLAHYTLEVSPSPAPVRLLLLSVLLSGHSPQTHDVRQDTGTRCLHSWRAPRIYPRPVQCSPAETISQTMKHRNRGGVLEASPTRFGNAYSGRWGPLLKGVRCMRACVRVPVRMRTHPSAPPQGRYVFATFVSPGYEGALLHACSQEAKSSAQMRPAYECPYLEQTLCMRPCSSQHHSETLL